MTIDIAGKLFPNFTTVIVQLLSTVIMFVLFKKFLWNYVRNYFNKRADFIESQVNEAKEMREKAKTLMEESEKQAQESALEYREIVEQAKSEALKIKDDMINEAKEEVKARLLQADRDIEMEKHQALEEVKADMVEVVIEAATHVSGKDMDTFENRKLIKEYMERVAE